VEDQGGEGEAAQDGADSREAKLRRDLADAQRVIQSLQGGSGAGAASSRLERRGEALARQAELGDVDDHLVENPATAVCCGRLLLMISIIITTIVISIFR